MFHLKNSWRRETLWSWTAALVVIFLDRASKKLWADAAELNPGISFSLPVSSGVVLGFFVVLLVWTVVRLQREQSVWVAAAYGALLGGAFSNLVDRWLYDGVRDIWTVPGLALRNNLADWAIFLSVAFLIGREVWRVFSPHRSA